MSREPTALFAPGLLSGPGSFELPPMSPDIQALYDAARRNTPFSRDVDDAPPAAKPTASRSRFNTYAEVTDDPEPEVAAAGHDRTIVNLKLENVEAWLTPEGRSVKKLLAILDDKQHPYCEHHKAASGNDLQ